MKIETAEDAIEAYTAQDAWKFAAADIAPAPARPSHAGLRHLPVASNAAGEKLSKQTLARAVDGSDPARLLVDALNFLGQQPPPGLAEAGLAAVWAWARQHWSMARVPRRRAVPAPRYG